MPYKDKNKALERAKERRKTKRGWASVKYSEMKYRCGRWKYYKNVRVTISKEDFIDLVERSCWEEMKCPSVDRIDSLGDYSLGNIQIIERGENSRKSVQKYFGCFVRGCNEKNFGRGFCVKHYTRYIRRGTISDMKRFGDEIDLSKV